MKDQWKYKAGELVELSAGGKKRAHNNGVLGMIGMILSIEEHNFGERGEYPYRIQWFGYLANLGKLPMKEYEIKRVRATR